MQLITQVLLAILLFLSTQLSATTLATANAGCGNVGDNQTGYTSASASCFSSFNGYDYSSSAESHPYSVMANTSGGPTSSTFSPGASADFESDVILTIFGAQGIGTASLNYAYFVSSEPAHNGFVQALINGKQSFYFDTGGILGFADHTISMTFGQPQLIHLGFHASVDSGLINFSSFSLSSSLALRGVFVNPPCLFTDPSCPDARTLSYTLVNAPEPSTLALSCLALVFAIAANALRLRRAVPVAE